LIQPSDSATSPTSVVTFCGLGDPLFRTVPKVAGTTISSLVDVTLIRLIALSTTLSCSSESVRLEKTMRSSPSVEETSATPLSSSAAFALSTGSPETFTSIRSTSTPLTPILWDLPRRSATALRILRTASVAQTKVPHSTSKERRLSLSSRERRTAPSPALSLGTPLIRTSESSSRSDASSVSLSSGLPLRT
jgi:hypothetical protein